MPLKWRYNLRQLKDPQMSEVTYWFHPESDSYYFMTEAPAESTIDDGLSVEIDEYKYVSGLIEQIDADPEHKLPEGIDAVIKLAAEWPENHVSGMIWYDKHERFANGHPITTTRCTKEPGGIYKTRNSKYLVHIVMPKESAVAKAPGEMVKEHG